MTALRAFFAMAAAYLYYPFFIGLFLWLFFKEAHWGFGLAVIIAMIAFDPMWRLLARTAIRKLSSNRQNK